MKGVVPKTNETPSPVENRKSKTVVAERVGFDTPTALKCGRASFYAGLSVFGSPRFLGIFGSFCAFLLLLQQHFRSCRVSAVRGCRIVDDGAGSTVTGDKQGVMRPYPHSCVWKDVPGFTQL
jgi:hypothetical protein